MAQLRSTASCGEVGFLNGSFLKIIACAAMTIDHVGAELLPQETWMRVIGRLAFPIFAFFIAEGCRYTRNRAKRLITIAALGAVCAGAYYICFHRWEGNILVTFSFSVAAIFLLQNLKRSAFARPARPLAAAAWLTAFAGLLAAAAVFNNRLGVDYGLLGILVPVFVSLFDFHDIPVQGLLKRLDCFPVRVLGLTAGLVLLCAEIGPRASQWYCLMAVPLISLYDGTPGNRKFKYLFYIYYPLHLLIIGIVSALLRR